ncbi:MAG: hypothetical protein HQ510_02500 [Candidatus Marinimicrobia bacterium]|nr:hypothetical protein [Candidatus Neomarinimicrobiota bacterium]
MAKKQSFGDKVGKASEKEQKTCIKLVRSTKSKKTKDGIRFSEEILGVPAGENVDSYVNNLLGTSK